MFITLRGKKMLGILLWNEIIDMNKLIPPLSILYIFLTVQGIKSPDIID